MRPVFFIVALICFSSLKGQKVDLAGLENELLEDFRKIAEWRFSEKENSYDSVIAANHRFTVKLKDKIKSTPGTLTYPFKSLKKEGLDIATSPDGRFRIYSWDTWTGGTMHFFDNLFQYKSESQVYTAYYEDKEGVDAKSWYDSIYQMKTGSQVVYLATDHSIGSTRDKGGSIQLFQIEKGELKPAKIIQTTSGLQPSIRIYFDMMQMKENQSWPAFKFDARSKTIFVPLIDDDDSPSDRFIRYKFDGKVFKKTR